MKKHIFFLLFLFASFAVFSHDEKKETELLNKIKVAADDTNKVNLLFDAFALTVYDNPKKAKEYADLSLNLSTKLEFQKGIAKSYGNIGTTFLYINNYDKALEFYEKSLKIREEMKDIKGMASSFNNIGTVYYYQGIYNKALENYFESLAKEEELKNDDGIASSYNNIGLIYDEQGNYDKALEYYQKSLDIRERQKKKEKIASLNLNIGAAYAKKKNNTKALECYKISLSMAKEIGDKEGVGTAYVNIGVAFSEEGLMDSALVYLYKSLSIRKELDDKRGIARCFQYMGTFYLKKGDYDKTIDFHTKAYDIAKVLGVKDIVKSVAEGLSVAYAKKQQFKLAYEFHVLYKQMSDSLNNEDNVKKMTQAAMQYEFDKKQKEQELEKKKRQLEFEADLNKQRLITGISIGGLIIMVLFAVVLYKNFRNKQRANKLLAAQKDEIEAQKAGLEDAHEIIQAKNKNITDSIRYARQIQQAILPTKDLIAQVIPDSFILYRPKDIVSGDFYWVEMQGDISLFSAVDCTGHGVPGAFLSIVGRNILKQAIKEQGLSKPSEILNFLNVNICNTLQHADEDETSVKDAMDLALCAYDRKRMILEFAGAHNPMFIVRGDQVLEFKADIHPIGAPFNEDMKSFKNHEIPVQVGDIVYVYTDGYVDQFGGSNRKKFLSKRLKETAIKFKDVPIPDLKEKYREIYEDWKGENEQIDDVLLMAVKLG